MHKGIQHFKIKSPINKLYPENAQQNGQIASQITQNVQSTLVNRIFSIQQANTECTNLKKLLQQNVSVKKIYHHCVNN